MQNKNIIRLRVYVLGLYLLLLPIDATLGNIIGDISIINYIEFFYIALRLTTMYKENMKISTLEKCKLPVVYFLYFIFSISWSITNDLNSWYIYSLMGSYAMFLFSAIDNYSIEEYRFLKKSVIYSGIVVIIITFFNIDIFSSNRFVLNVGRYMDPNYFATGFVLITSLLIDNILKKEYKEINMIILVCLMIIIIMTGSRGGLLANLAVIFSFLIVNKKDGFRKLIVVLSGVLSFGAIFYFTREYIPSWVLDRFVVNEMFSGGGSGRVYIWASNILYYKDLSLLRLIFGNGYSVFPYISMQTMGMYKVAHSIFVQSLLEGGMVGLLITIMLILAAMRNSLKSDNKYMFAALIGVTIGGITLDIHVSRFFWNALFFSTFPNFEILDKTVINKTS